MSAPEIAPTSGTFPRFPEVTVELIGRDGNVFNVIGLTARAMRSAGLPAADVSAFTDAAMASGSYDEVLRLVMRTVEVV
jgi:hypothetical protein